MSENAVPSLHAPYVNPAIDRAMHATSDLFGFAF